MLARIIFLFLMLADAQGPWVGAWKMSPAGRYKRIVSKIEPWADGLKVTYDMVGVRGGVTHLEWTGKFDGKDYPVEGADYILTNAYTLINDHSYQIVVKVEGNVVATARVEVSPDGKKLTTVTTEKDAQGHMVSTTAVYEKM